LFQVHFIFKYKNPLTGEYEEKHLQSPPNIKADKITNLYTLVVRPDNSFSIFINLKEVKKGSLLTDFKPSVNPPKEINDPSDTKPEDWVDDEYIPDESAQKPEDWDENEPREIPDVDAIMPDGWLEDEPEYIRDPKAKIPEDWSVEEDGDFEAPMIRKLIAFLLDVFLKNALGNPKCEVGCGPWKAPMVKNPKYKGVWKRPEIKNPLFKGVWAPRRIPNPGYYEDLHPHNFEPIEAIGFEIWTMSEGITFDNIYIGFDEKEAKEFAVNTFSPKFKVEKAMADKDSEELATPVKYLLFHFPNHLPNVEIFRMLLPVLYLSFANGLTTFFLFGRRNLWLQPWSRIPALCLLWHSSVFPQFFSYG
jgi:calnexin